MPRLGLATSWNVPDNYGIHHFSIIDLRTDQVAPIARMFRAEMGYDRRPVPLVGGQP